MARKKDIFQSEDDLAKEAEEWFMDNDIYPELDEDILPECCQACGGPYPMCVEGCKIFGE